VNIPRLLIWTVLFCGLLAYVVLCEQPRQPAKQTEGGKFPAVFSVLPQDISGLEIIAGSRTLSLARGAAGWSADCPSGAPVNQEIIESLIAAVVDAVVVETVADNPGDLAQYGLAEPRLQLHLASGQAKEPAVLLIGKDSPSGVSCYALLRGSTKVMLIGKYLLFSIKALLDSCR